MRWHEGRITFGSDTIYSDRQLSNADTNLVTACFAISLQLRSKTAGASLRSESYSVILHGPGWVELN